MEKLKAIRGGHRSAITRLVNRTDDKISENEIGNQELSAAIETLVKKRNFIENLDTQILDGTEVENMEQEIFDSQEYNLHLEVAIHKFKDILSNSGASVLKPMNSSKLLTESMGNCKGKISKESKSQMRGEAYRPTSSKPDTMQGQETGNVGDKLDNKNGNKEDAVVINAKLPFVNPESPTKSETVLQGTGSNKSVSDTNGLKANDYMGKQDKKQNESNAIPEKPVEKPNKDVLSTENIKNNTGEETNFNEAPTGISLNKVPGSKSDDAEIDKPYLFSKGVPKEEPQMEDLGFTDKITGIQGSEPTDQSSSSHETVPTEKAIDEDKSSTTEHDKLQPGNTSSDKLQPKNTPSDKSQTENAPSDNQQNNDDSTGYNRSKFSNPGDEQDKKMSKEMKESDGQKRKKKKKKPDKYDPPPNAIIQNYYGHVDVLNLGNDNVYMGKKEKKEEKVETFQPTSTISALEMKVLLKVSESVGIFHGPGETGTCWRVGKDKVMTAAHVVKHNIWSTFHNFLNENKYKECYVDFNYNGKKSKDTDSKYVFDIEKTVYFDPDTLDVAVLKLKRETHKEFPPPLESFKILDPEKNDDQHIYLIGHDKGDKLHINYGIGLWNPTEKRLKDLEKFCQKYGKENGYKELDRKDRLVIQCKFVSGASGCPGVIIHEDKATVVLIYTRGFPDFYFSKNFPEKKRREFPNERLLQQGVNIGPVFKSMTRNKRYLDLRNEIFPHLASEEQQQLNGQHQYAIDGAKKSINTYNPESSFENVKNLEDHITVRQETENNMAKVTTCTEGHSETAIKHASKYDRQESYALATGKRENIAYSHMKPPADDTDKTLQQETNLDVNAASEILDTVQEDKSVPNTNPGKIQPVTDITIEEWIGHDIQAYQGNQLKDLDLSILSKAINISKANSVALQLGLSQSDFEIIRYQTQADLCYLILYKWRNKTGNAATLEKLIGNLFRAWESDNGSVFTEQLKSAILKVMK